MPSPTCSGCWGSRRPSRWSGRTRRPARKPAPTPAATPGPEPVEGDGPAGPAGAAVPSPWPAGARFDDDGLSIAGVPATDLAGSFGTPLLVVDEEDVRARCRSFREAFPRVLFAVKAFPAYELIRIALSEGLGLLVA